MSASIYSRPLFIITHWNQERTAETVRMKIAGILNIPPNYIEIKQNRKPCEQSIPAMLHLCILDSKVDFIVKKINTKLLHMAFDHFKN